MDKVQLGKTGYSVSKMGLGTVQFGIDYGFTKKKNQQEVDEILSCADRHGINFIDTAREYGDSEEKIGTYTSQNVNSLIIATKLEKLPLELTGNPIRLREAIYRSVEKSRSHLRVDKISLLQLHQTDEWLITNRRFWEIVGRLKEDKAIDGFGVSVYNERETEYLLLNYHELIDFFQVPYNIFDRRFSRLERQISERSIGLISRSTFLKGIIPCAIDSLPAYLEGLSKYKEKLHELAEERSMKPEELALLFVYYNRFISSTIIGVDTSKELLENIRIIEKYHSCPFHYPDLDALAVDQIQLIDPRQWHDF